MRHFQQNCCDKLHNLEIRKANEQKFFIETVFGTATSQCILDADDKVDLKAGMLAEKEPLDTEEKKLTGKEKPKFWSYLHSCTKMMTKCMIATARKKVGMSNDKSGKSLKSCTNQSESINNKLT